jgi:glycosyltransferase involved in cell wall biosynthesis
MRRKIRILHAYKSFYPDVFGGIPYVIDIMSRLAPDKFEQSILVTTRSKRKRMMRGDVFVESVRSWGDVLSLPMAPFYPFMLWLRARNADVVVLHAPYPLADLVLGLFLSRHQKLIVYWHSHIVSQKKMYFLIRPLLLRSLKRADCLIISHPAIIYAGSILEPFRDKCAIIPYAVDTQIFAPSNIAISKVADTPLVVACGRLVKYKGFDVLVEAARSVDANIVIVGEGIERAALSEQIASAGVGQRVSLVGSLPQADLIFLLSAAWIFVLPSVSSAETFGIAQVEAMACGCAIINTNVPTAVPEIARNGLEALTVPPRDAPALSQALQQLLNNSEMRERLATNARERAVVFYDQKIYEQTLSDLISSLFGGADHDARTG